MADVKSYARARRRASMMPAPAAAMAAPAAALTPLRSVPVRASSPVCGSVVVTVSTVVAGVLSSIMASSSPSRASGRSGVVSPGSVGVTTGGLCGVLRYVDREAVMAAVVSDQYEVIGAGCEAGQIHLHT